MTTRNVYATLAEFKNFFTARGGTPSTDATDDGVIEQLLEAASRFLDAKTGRAFYPSILTRQYDAPDGRIILFFTDVLEILSILNGDGTSVASTEYHLMPYDESPKWALRIKQTSTLIWEPDSDGQYEAVIDINAVEGYHPKYSSLAWASAGTLGAAIGDLTTLTFTMSAGHSVAAGRVLRIDNELFPVASVVTNTVTVIKRGDNGSTAAEHLINTTVYQWQPMEEARNAVCEIVNTAYRRRFGQTVSGEARVTAAGVVISPRDIPAMAQAFIQTYQRRVFS
jgi:hypothetical protein